MPRTRRSNSYWSVFDLTGKQSQLDQLEREAAMPDFWNDSVSAQRVMKNVSSLRSEVDGWGAIQQQARDFAELAKLEDESLRPELESEIQKLESELQKRSFAAMLSGPFDHDDAILAIHAGAGGTDSQDWAEMLQRMYLRWCESRGFAAEILDSTPGEEAGIKSVTISVSGQYVYGYLRSEKGVHRLVRLSPFDAAHRRHTSFALVEILPQVTMDEADVEINANDIKIDVFRSSGAGGQNVQKNATAVRLTHLPTGIVVTCQNERSQTQNREFAMRILRARLVELKRAEREEERAVLRGEYTKAEWGSQIRSYVLHPYQMVKDHRTDFQVGSAQSVLDGDLDGFMEDHLKNTAGGKK
ncbi:MAG: peptide chain release factor 2 [Anaerolineales bacterium]|jgi:peptide chain release factor 2|nr:peptide chain release factor 2 [Chloroflexota bacterium]MBK6647680.1 peptide chain release factor 2 [Anaerolineales bacterium]MCC6986944.1 peptide chain release factor 2 [Anaerolineales bacterium]